MDFVKVKIFFLRYVSVTDITEIHIILLCVCMYTVELSYNIIERAE